MRAFLSFAILIPLATGFLLGCGGNAPKPIRVSSASDVHLSCADIKRQVIELLDRANAKSAEAVDSDSSNLSIWIAGQILLLPMIGMDVTGAAEIERRAIVKRIDRLKSLAQTKEC